MASLYQHPFFQLRNWALPLALYWTCGFAVLAVAELRGWAPRWLLVLLTGPAALLALMHYYHGFLRLAWAFKTYRKHLPRLIVRMSGLLPKLARFRLETTKAVVHLVLAIVGLTLFIRFGVHSTVALSALLVAIVITILLRALLPPGGVYLASSSPERLKFLSQLSKRTVPAFAALLEVSNLVDPHEEGFSIYRDAPLLLNDYRTTKPDDWTIIVSQLIEMTAVVVVDGRDQTPGVQYEVERILRNRLEFKTTFLSTDGNMPLVLSRLNAESSHPSGTFQVMSPAMALEVVPVIIQEARAFWIPVRMDA